jgi:serine/threonine protein kinase, bacterial
MPKNNAQKQCPKTMNDNKAILISAAIVASAIVLSSILILTRDNAPRSSTVVSQPSPVATPIDVAPIAPQLPSSSPEPVVIPSNPPTPLIAPSSENKPYNPPSAPVYQPQPIPLPSISVRPIPAVKPSDSPPVVNIQRPATDSFIQGYYGKLKNAQYQSAWQDLSEEFQGNRSANPGGYNGEYLKWWSSFGKNTKVKKVETVKTTPERATVRVHCQFQSKSYIAQYYLRFDAATGAWKIYGIDKLS